MRKRFTIYIFIAMKYPLQVSKNYKINRAGVRENRKF